MLSRIWCLLLFLVCWSPLDPFHCQPVKSFLSFFVTQYHCRFRLVWFGLIPSGFDSFNLYFACSIFISQIFRHWWAVLRRPSHFSTIFAQIDLLFLLSDFRHFNQQPFEYNVPLYRNANNESFRRNRDAPREISSLKYQWSFSSFFAVVC